MRKVESFSLVQMFANERPSLLLTSIRDQVHYNGTTLHSFFNVKQSFPRNLDDKCEGSVNWSSRLDLHNGVSTLQIALYYSKRDHHYLIPFTEKTVAKFCNLVLTKHRFINPISLFISSQPGDIIITHSPNHPFALESMNDLLYADPQ